MKELMDKIEKLKSNKSIFHQKSRVHPKVVRFELPYPIYCNGCHKRMDTGKRFNAKKKQIGMYHSSKIYLFTFTCKACPQRLAIKTNPATTTYDIVSGCRPPAKPSTNSRDDHKAAFNSLQGLLTSEEEREKRDSNPIYALEKKKLDKERYKTIHQPQLQKLLDKKSYQSQFHMDINGELRRRARERKHALASLRSTKHLKGTYDSYFHDNESTTQQSFTKEEEKRIEERYYQLQKIYK
mmetsp:Transcript_12719/g.19129  ORF Transcript_12719/g.19129 Transcript_12719/m.19129 type:complete len:239 (+) Transcript_12719:59-775(+)